MDDTNQRRVQMLILGLLLILATVGAGTNSGYYCDATDHIEVIAAVEQKKEGVDV